jgi:hypothetical protein
MIQFKATIKQFESQGEKTGWRYIEIPAALAQQLMPGTKKAFRVKGLLDSHPIEKISLVPMGGGDFILAVNSTIRKAIKKTTGAIVNVKLEVDNAPVIICPELIECLADEPAALAFFNKLPGSHQKYYSRWIESAKTEATKAKRIAQTVTACSRAMGYGEMIRSIKAENELLGK